MLSKEDNEKLTRVGPGTPMGELMRRFWIPACLAEEVPEPNCPPVRVRLLGEDLIAFRDTDGKVGLVDAFCPHRRAPMFFGRNEECGLRCVYHGWKFDVEGTCVDAPNEPNSDFKDKVNITAYPTYEAADVIWTYMGPPDKMPPKPNYEFIRVPKKHYFISKTFQDSNWLQALEGGIDLSHSSFAHNNNLADKNALRTVDPHPKIEVVKTDYGYFYGGIRNLRERGLYVRVAQYIVPFHQMRGAMTRWDNGGLEKTPTVNGHMWVPIDDNTTYVYNWMYSRDESTPVTEEHIEYYETIMGRWKQHRIQGPEYKLIQNKANDYLIDREVQRTKTFTGIDGVNTQDMALQEGMGQIVDRSKEKLGTADVGVIAARQLLLEALENMAEGKEIKGIDPKKHGRMRACDFIIPQGTDWKIELRGEMTAKW